VDQAAHFVHRNLALRVLLKNAMRNLIELKSFDPKRAYCALYGQTTVNELIWSKRYDGTGCSGHIALLDQSFYRIAAVFLIPAL
jgi:hypothetical protein